MNLRFAGRRRRRRDRPASRSRSRVALARGPLEALEVRSLLSQVFTVIDTSDSTSAGSLRWAIGRVNSDATDGAASPDRIDFDIPTTDPGYGLTTPGVWTIAPATALPTLTRVVLIDGYTQPGAVANTSAAADNAVIKVELSGVRASIPSGLSFGPGSGALMADGTYGPSAPGWLTADSSGVRGLAIHSFAADISMDTGFDTLVDGCFLGTDASGQAPASGARRADVGIDQLSGSTSVGGAPPAARNLIANCAVGVRMGGGGGGQILGNLIGTDRTGLLALPNTDGVTTVGGDADVGPGNVISGNLDAGIVVDGGLATVEGNDIGTDATGEAALGNGVAGIRVVGGFLSQIGDTTPGARNVISGNGALGTGRLRGGIVLTGGVDDCRVYGNSIGTDASATRDLGNFGSGIVVDSGNSDSFAANAIAFNTGLGIDLVGGTEDAFGVTANSPGGPHTGPNSLQNYPVLTSAAASATSTAIGGTLNGVPDATFTIQFYSNPTADPSGHGQGLDYLGSTTVVTDASGNAPFRFNAPGDLAGRFLTATATYAGSATLTMLPGDTSEFSADIQATASSQAADLSVTATATPDPHLIGDNVTEEFTVTNKGPDAAEGLGVTLQINDSVVSLTSSDPSVTIPALPAFIESSLTVSIAVPALASGQSVTFTLVDSGGSNTLAVASLTPDPDLTNNSATVSSPGVYETTTSLGVSPDLATFGQVVTFTASPANVQPVLYQAPGGTVTFSIDGVPTATVPLTGSAYRLDYVDASFSTSTLAVGTHRITAHYDGEAPDLPSDATPVTLVVAPASTATVLVARPNPSAGGQPVVFTAGVASITGAVPTGAVTFFIDGVGHTGPGRPLGRRPGRDGDVHHLRAGPGRAHGRRPVRRRRELRPQHLGRPGRDGHDAGAAPPAAGRGAPGRRGLAVRLPRDADGAGRRLRRPARPRRRPGPGQLRDRRPAPPGDPGGQGGARARRRDGRAPAEGPAECPPGVHADGPRHRAFGRVGSHGDVPRHRPGRVDHDPQPRPAARARPGRVEAAREALGARRRRPAGRRRARPPRGARGSRPAPLSRPAPALPIRRVGRVPFDLPGPSGRAGVRAEGRSCKAPYSPPGHDRAHAAGPRGLPAAAGIPASVTPGRRGRTDILSWRFTPPCPTPIRVARSTPFAEILYSSTTGKYSP